jgi:FkbM family methyltransferase
VRFRATDEFIAKVDAESRPKLVEIEREGFALYVRPGDVFVGKAISDTAEWEPHVAAEVKRVLKEGHTFVDVGANVGYVTMLAARIVGSGGRVVAIEPNPANVDLIRQSADRNGFRHVTILLAAASDHEGDLVIAPDRASSLSLLIDERSSADFVRGWRAEHSSGRVPGMDAAITEGALPPSECRVRAARLDELLAPYGHIHVVKIDTDGHDDRVLLGMTGLLTNYRPTIISEFSPTLYGDISGGSPQSMFDLLILHGYQVFSLEPTGAVTRLSTFNDVESQLAKTGTGHLDVVARP